MQAIRDNATDTVDEWVEFLSTKKDDVKKKILDKRDEYGMAAIHYAAKFNRYCILEKLCRIGAGKYRLISDSNTLPVILSHSFFFSSKNFNLLEGFVQEESVNMISYIYTWHTQKKTSSTKTSGVGCLTGWFTCSNVMR